MRNIQRTTLASLTLAVRSPAFFGAFRCACTRHQVSAVGDVEPVLDEPKLLVAFDAFACRFRVHASVWRLRPWHRIELPLDFHEVIRAGVDHDTDLAVHARLVNQVPDIAQRFAGIAYGAG